jgi:hypothetical protein
VIEVCLSSNYADYYDSAFHPSGVEFNRNRKRQFQPRSSVFRFLQSLGLRVPIFGTSTEVLRSITQEWMLSRVDVAPGSAESVLPDFCDLISYSPSAHMLSGPMAAVSVEEDCSEFLASEGPGCVVWRYVQVGGRRFWMEMRSLDSWHSRRGDCTVKLLSEDTPGFYPGVPLPIFTIDFIPGRHLYAINFDASPELAGSPVEDVLSPDEVVSEIGSAIEYWAPPPRRSA